MPFIMQTTNKNKLVSNLRKTITAFFVVSVLVVSALTINSIQSNTQLQAQTGLFSRVFSGISNILGSDTYYVEPSMDSIAHELEDGSVFLFSDEYQDVFLNLDKEEQNSILAIRDNVFFIEDNMLNQSDQENSFFVIFEREPIAQRTKNILARRRGISLTVGDQSREKTSSEIKKIEKRISRHRAKIQKQQDAFLSTLSERFSQPEVVRNDRFDIKIYDRLTDSNDPSLIVRQFKTAINAVTVENITKEELDELLQGVRGVASVQPVEKTSILLEEASSMIDIESIYSMTGLEGHALTGEGIVIAILDTGVDYMHPDLGGCSFLVQGGCKVIGGYDFINNDSDPMDDHGHGTHVAATAAGKGLYVDEEGNTKQINGIAPDAKILAYKVLSANGAGTSISTILGIEACIDPNGDGLIDDRVDVCSLSLGSPNGSPFSPSALAADAAVDAGVIMTIAAGNNGPGLYSIASPGSSLKSITVGAACKNSQIGSLCPTPMAVFSSRGPLEYIENGTIQSVVKPDIVAPGVNICAAQWSDWQNSKSCLGTGQHISISGTSMATPVVAGVMAVLSQAHPDLTPLQLKTAIQNGALNLGLSEYVQGPGLIQVDSTMSMLGYPSSSLRIVEGSPWFMNDDSSELISNYSRLLVLENISEDVLNFQVDYEISNPGVSLDVVLSENAQNVGPGDFFEIEIVLTINHLEIDSGSFFETMHIVYGDGEVFNLRLSWYIPPYLQVQNNVVVDNHFHPLLDSFSEEVTFPVTNRMSEQSFTYDVELDLSNIPTQFHDNFSLMNYANQITLNPLETQNFDFTIIVDSANGNVLPAGKYFPRVKFSSDQETVFVGVEIVKGYVFHLVHENQEPDYILFANQDVQLTLTPNVGSRTTIITTQPGPFNVAAFYTNNQDNDKRVYSVLFQNEIQLNIDTNSPEFDVSRDLTEYSITNLAMSGGSCMWQFNNTDSSVRFLGILEVPTTRHSIIRYNSVSDDLRFSQSCISNFVEGGNSSSLSSSQIYLTQNINNDFVLLKDETTETLTHLYGFNQKNIGNPVRFGVHTCNMANYRNQGFVNSSAHFCIGKINTNQNYYDGDLALVRSYSLYDATPESSSVPDYPNIIFSMRDAVDNTLLAATPNIFITQDNVYAWQRARTGFLTETSSSSNFYETYRVPLFSKDVITLGVGPLINTSTVINFKQYFGYIGSFFGTSVSPFMFADGSSELFLSGSIISQGMKIDFNRNGSYFAGRQFLFSLGNSLLSSKGSRFPFITKSFSPLDNFTFPATGSYQVDISRIGNLLNFNEGFLDTQLSFDVSYNSSFDNMPPYLLSAQLVSNSMLQNYFDASVPNTLRLFLSPGNGVIGRSVNPVNEYEVYDLEFAQDDIVDISLHLTLESDQNYNNELSVVWNDEGYYEVDLNNIQALNDDTLYFALVASDQAGNVLDTNFAIRTGSAVSIELDDLLTECIEYSPVINLSAGELYVEPGEVVPLSISLQNMDTLLCANRTFSSMFRSAVETPGNNKIRFGYNPNVGNTTNGGVTFQNLAPQQISTRTIYIKPDQGLVEGLYNMLLELENINPSIDNIYIPVNVGYFIEEEIPSHCAADFNGDGIVNIVDQLLFLQNFGSTNLQFDLTGDGVVGDDDLSLFLEYFGGVECPTMQSVDAGETEELGVAETNLGVSIEYVVLDNGINNREYEIIITSTSNQTQSNILIPNILPVNELENAQFSTATVPGVQFNPEDGVLTIPQINPSQTISVFVMVTE
jgi:subtilisin family serine protease